MSKASNVKTGVKRFHFTIRESAVLHGIDDRYKGKKVDTTTPKAETAESNRIKELLQQVEAESDRALGELLKKNEPEAATADFDEGVLKNLDTKEELVQQIQDLKELEGAAESSDDEMAVADDDSDAERIKTLNKAQKGSDDEEDDDMEEGEDEKSDAEDDENL